ncbi:SPOR domain-containing protein [Halodesulfovibrio spirochaetisodalis]|uniref:SPOR domain-containing protein n=1 Tax=Halodesulfovibrio spirochaetisodalis TaxID=1560234 RepID=A0A1B7X932_9BACT|nr:SPOR domain-containing protein [Halodesulfovibrio spirochaetisodalis]OBQ45899.1 hypothetical protein SP90_15535 [Halodesulfovibrio spirochaetisodalis]
MGFVPTTTKDKDTGKSIFNFSLCLPELIGLTVIILVGFIWVFIFGLLVGRGYQPEEALPELKHIMPAQKQVAQATPAPVVKQPAEAASAQPDSTPHTTTPAKVQPVVEKKKEKVLSPEQLNFFEQLKAKETSTSSAKASAPKKATVAAKRKSPAERTAPKSKPVKSVSSAAKQPAPKQQASLEKNGPTFEYIYQLAASTNEEAATKLRSEIKAKGFTTSMATAVIKTTKWYRVNVHFVGQADQVSTFKSRLAKAGYKTPLLKKKKQK